MRELRARELVDLTPLLGEHTHRLAYGVGFDGAVYAVGASSPGRDRPSDYRLVWWRGGASGSVTLSRERLGVWCVQPHPEGFLLVDPRSNPTLRENALVLDWDGREKARFTLGDGIEDVRTSEDGTLWVSYFDEGVFGGDPLAAPGLRAFAANGDPGAAYDAGAAGTDTVDDCYAMNVVGPDDVFIYFYSAFPIVRMHQGTYRVWRCDLGGARALAVRGDRALLFGAYRDASTASVLELGAGERAQSVEDVVITGPDGEPVDSARAFGVGAALLLLVGSRVLVLDAW